MTYKSTRLTSIVLSSPDPPALARFYGRLLGWEITVNRPDWVKLPDPDGGAGLAFHIEDIWTQPTWPSEPGAQIIQMHLDIGVENLDAGAGHAEACGARLAAHQPQDDVRVYLDPDGHPFCLFESRPPSG